VNRIVVFVFCRKGKFIKSKHALDRLYKHFGFCDSFRGNLWLDFDSGVVRFYAMRFRAAQIGRQFAIYLSRSNGMLPNASMTPLCVLGNLSSATPARSSAARAISNIA